MNMRMTAEKNAIFIPIKYAGTGPVLSTGILPLPRAVFEDERGILRGSFHFPDVQIPAVPGVVFHELIDGMVVDIVRVFAEDIFPDQR